MKRIKIDYLMGCIRRIESKKKEAESWRHYDDKAVIRCLDTVDTEKRIMLKSEDFEAVNNALNEVQKRSRTRTCTVGEVIRAAIEADDRMHGMPKKYKEGIKVTADPNAQDFPNAYKYVPESTVVDFEYKRGSWYIVDIRRDTCTNKEISFEELTQEQKDKLVEAVLSGKNK